MEEMIPHSPIIKPRLSPQKIVSNATNQAKNHVHPQVGAVVLYGVPIVSLVIESQERLCLAQISNTLLKQFSYNEIHNRRVALGITCVQCTPVQLEILRRAGAMPVSSRRCGMITRREAERLCKSFLGDNAPPRLPDDFAFSVHHECAWGCRGAFLPARYNSSRAKCIKCSFCGLFFSPNKFIFHSHRTTPNATYVQPDAANFNSWRRHMKLSGSPPDNVVFAWEDVKAMFNGGTRKRMLSGSSHSMVSANSSNNTTSSKTSPTAPPPKQLKMESPPPAPAPSPYPHTSPPTPLPIPHRVPPFPDLPMPISMMDYVWHGMEGLKPSFFSPYLPWLGSSKRNVLGYASLLPSPDSETQSLSTFQQHGKLYHQSAFRPVYPAVCEPSLSPRKFADSSSPAKELSPRAFDLNVCEIKRDRSSFEVEKSVKSPAEVLKCEAEDSTDSNDSVIMRVVPRSQRLPENLLLSRPDLLRALSRMKSEDKDYGRSDSKFEPEVEENLAEEDEDETVDIETTDDSPATTISHARADNEEYPKTIKSTASEAFPQNRIWTIARFSLGDSVSEQTETNEKFGNLEHPANNDDQHVMNLTTTGVSSVSSSCKLDYVPSSLS